jgi:hypothetical protein
LGWLKSNPRLVVRDQTKRTLDDGLQALSFDLDLSATASTEDPSCPTLCYSYLSVNEPTEPYGTAKGERAYMYLTTIGSGATSHILLIVLDNGTGGSRGLDSTHQGCEECAGESAVAHRSAASDAVSRTDRIRSVVGALSVALVMTACGPAGP